MQTHRVLILSEKYVASPELKDKSLGICNEIKQFVEEYPESLPHLEEVIKLFVNDWKKESAEVTPN